MDQRIKSFINDEGRLRHHPVGENSQGEMRPSALWLIATEKTQDFLQTSEFDAPPKPDAEMVETSLDDDETPPVPVRTKIMPDSDDTHEQDTQDDAPEYLSIDDIDELSDVLDESLLYAEDADDADDISQAPATEAGPKNDTHYTPDESPPELPQLSTVMDSKPFVEQRTPASNKNDLQSSVAQLFEVFFDVLVQTNGVSNGGMPLNGDTYGLSNDSVQAYRLLSLARGEVPIDMPDNAARLTREQAITVHKLLHFDAIKLGHIRNAQVAGHLFMIAVQHGPKQTALWFQQAINNVMDVGLPVNGLFNRKTRAIFHDASPAESTAIDNEITALRKAFLDSGQA